MPVAQSLKINDTKLYQNSPQKPCKKQGLFIHQHRRAC
jgi:hypothetical protein